MIYTAGAIRIEINDDYVYGKRLYKSTWHNETLYKTWKYGTFYKIKIKHDKLGYAYGEKKI